MDKTDKTLVEIRHLVTLAMIRASCGLSKALWTGL